jgi:hypothetical protein
MDFNLQEIRYVPFLSPRYTIRKSNLSSRKLAT